MSKHFLTKMLIAITSIGLAGITLLTTPTLHQGSTMNHSTVSALCIDECLTISLPLYTPVAPVNLLQIGLVLVFSILGISLIPQRVSFMAYQRFKPPQDLIKLNMRYIS